MKAMEDRSIWDHMEEKGGSNQVCQPWILVKGQGSLLVWSSWLFPNSSMWRARQNLWKCLFFTWNYLDEYCLLFRIKLLGQLTKTIRHDPIWLTHDLGLSLHHIKWQSSLRANAMVSQRFGSQVALLLSHQPVSQILGLQAYSLHCKAHNFGLPN